MDKKTHSFEIAKEIVKKEGFSSLTIRRLAKESGISVGTVYNFFGTKENLLTEIIRSYWDQSIKKVLDGNKVHKGDTIDKIENLYLSFFHTSDDFHSNWIYDLEGIRMGNKAIYDMSQEYLKMIINRVKELLIEDDLISKQFDNIFNLDRLSKLIHNMYFNIIPANQEDDLEFLRISLKRLLNL